MLTELLPLILKGAITGIGSKGGQTLLEKIKEHFEPAVAEKIGEAYLKASLSDDKEPVDFFEDDSYYKQLIYSFNLIDGSELSEYQRNISKRFLREVFKDQSLAFEVLNNKSDRILRVGLDSNSTLKSIENILKDQTITKTIFDSYSKMHFLAEHDYENFPTYYIPRRIANSEYQFADDSITSFKELIEYSILLNKNTSKPIRAIILADGGIGKSVYSKYLAKDCSSYKDIYPVFVSLRDLKPTDILQDYVTRRFPELSSINKKNNNQLSFFLDGLDEIGDSSAAIKQVSDFSTTYSNSHIILTSRRNSFFGELPDFLKNNIYILLDLNYADIKEYITKKYARQHIDPTHFFNEVTSNGFQNLIYNPFYLDVLIDCYIANRNSLNISKKQLIDNLITSRREKDIEKRPDLLLNRPNVKLKILKLGRQFAFTQALMDQRSLSENNIAHLFGNDFDLAINSLPIRKGQITNGEQQWEFEHNIFLEHLVSDVLKDLELLQILEYTSSNETIKSKWRDIVSHLLGILDESNSKEKEIYDSLINWLAEHDAEILLKLEESQLPKEFRSRVFLQMYHRYQEKTIWIDTNKVDIESMASFGETRENVDLLFKDIVYEKEHYRRRINASLIFRHFSFADFSDVEKKTIEEQYISCLSNLNCYSDEQKRSLEHYLISNCPFIDGIDKIIKLYSTTSDSQLISAILHVINEYELQDKYIETVITFYLKERQHKTTGNYFINSSYSLTQLKEETSYITFFNRLADENVYDSFLYYNRDEFKIVIKNSVKFASAHLIKSVLMIYSRYVSWSSSSSDEYEIFTPFFENEYIRKTSLEMLLEFICVKEIDGISDWMFMTSLARIIKATDLPHIFESIYNQELYITILLQVEKGSKIYNEILLHLKEKYNYSPIVRIDPWIERRKDEFSILFDKKRFKEECLTQFEIFGNSFSPHELYKEERKNGGYTNVSIRAFMSWFVGDGEISKTRLEKWFEEKPDKLDDYLHQKICKHIPQWNSSGTMPNFTEYQKDVIKSYYQQRILQTSFLLNVNRETNSLTHASFETYVLITYMKRFNFECPDCKLCEMLGNYIADFNFIVKKISDKQKLIKCILDNLENYPLFLDSRLYSMIEYCVDNKVIEAHPSIQKILTDSSLKDFDKVSIIKYCIKNNILVEDIIKLSTHLTQYQVLELCEELIKSEYSNKDVIKEKLYTSLESPEEDKHELFALSLLIWLKDKNALNLFINYSKRNSKITFNSPFDGVVIGREHLPDNYLQYDDIDLLPQLMELLELSMQSDMKTTRRGAKIESNIIHLASLSDDNYIEVTSTLEEFIEKNKENYEDVEFIYYTIDRIEKAYKEKNAKCYSFKEAKQISDFVLD